MKIAFCLYQYFPYGGLQRDFMRIAQECLKQKHRVRVYVIYWQGDYPKNMDIIIVPIRAWLRKNLYQKYGIWVKQHLANNPVHCVVGFNYLPKPDIYYAADSCYLYKLKKQRRSLYALTPRAKRFAMHEQSICDNHSIILCLSKRCYHAFKDHHNIAPPNLKLLPPAIRYTPITKSAIHKQKMKARHKVMTQLNINPNDQKTSLILTIGSSAYTKGLDRTIVALKSYLKQYNDNNTHVCLLVIGMQPKLSSYIDMMSIKKHSYFIDARSELTDFYLAADLLIHPARWEMGGMVLLEALNHGLPVLSSDICGYAHHIDAAKSGVILAHDFRQQQLNQALALGLNQPLLRRQWQDNAIDYAQAHNWHPSNADKTILETITSYAPH